VSTPESRSGSGSSPPSPRSSTSRRYRNAAYRSERTSQLSIPISFSVTPWVRRLNDQVSVLGLDLEICGNSIERYELWEVHHSDVPSLLISLRDATEQTVQPGSGPELSNKPRSTASSSSSTALDLSEEDRGVLLGLLMQEDTLSPRLRRLLERLEDTLS
jgi:hypothetical protein